MEKLNGSEPLALKSVKIKDKFWQHYIKLIHDVVLPYQWEALNDRVPDAEPSHAVMNFKIAAGIEKGEFYGRVFQDSDVAKWIEAAAYAIETEHDEKLMKTADEMIDIIEKAQRDDGYLNTYFTLKEPGKRWTNLRECHEMYCAGHMIEAAVAYYRATGKTKLLNVACRLADHIDSIFGPEEGKKRGYPGHQELELALFKLYKVTGNKKYLRLSKYFIDERGKEPYYFDKETAERGNAGQFYGFAMNRKYAQTYLPVREQTTAEGHAVRAVYMYTAMADLAKETKDKGLYDACRRIWNNITQRRMYITGGIGSMEDGEAFSLDYDLPNDTAYAETCASVGLIFFASRMLRMEAKSIYADVMERALYNTVISGISLDGKKFFYVNPLEVWPEACENNTGKYHVNYVRQKWFSCACCPPNIARLIASLGQYIYTQSDDTIYVHLYVGGETEIYMGESRIKIIEETDYPQNGNIDIKLLLDGEKNFKVALRIPGWCTGAKIKVNGSETDIKEAAADGYVYLNRTWESGDEIQMSFDMPVLRIKANPIVREDIGKLAIQRGPFVYCLEEEDNGKNLHEVILPESAKLEEHYDADLLGGITYITAEGKRITDGGFNGRLYGTDIKNITEPVKLKFIPYYAWANRSAGEMVVWVRDNK